MLEIDGLSKRFGTVVALDGATFDVAPGRIVGFLGPNGAGKTTTMRCIFGLINPDAGAVRWNGRQVGLEERLRFGYMPEERGLYPKMKVRDELSYFGELSGLTRKRARGAAEQWLDRLGLTDRALSRLEELSHGNQQRVQLATALVHSPELLVLDEPFSGLDPLGIEAMSEMLTDLAAQGVAIMFSSHQLDLVEDICQDVVIIDRGRVVVAGHVGELKAATGRVRIAISVDGQPWTPQSAQAGRGNPRRTGFLASADVGLDQILTEAEASGAVTAFAYGPPHLSDLFREAVGT